MKIISDTKYKNNQFKIVTAENKDGDIGYAAVNLETGVVEFASEVLSFTREWIEHFGNRLAELDAGVKAKDLDQDAIPKPQRAFPDFN